ncbi:MAG: hypothetical protein K2K89_08215 [Ruminococcus sp.]|nr:hypothetical protein [Ruminococcus sp.]
MEDLKKALALADENFLIGLSNKGTYKRALKDISGETSEFDFGENSAEVRTGGEVCTINANIAESKCTCVSRGICRHIIGAIIILKNNLDIKDIEYTKPPEIVPVEKTIESEPEKPPEEFLSGRDTEKIHNCIKQCIETLGNVIKYGLVRIPESLPDMLEASAVRCHALKMADAERSLRETGSRLSDCVARRASFRMEGFINEVCHCTEILTGLLSNNIKPEQLGSFRQTYVNYGKKLTILPVGMRNVSGDYTGSVYYFLNIDPYAEQKFFSISDIRPVFYDNNMKHFHSNSTVWGMDVPLKNMMRSEMVLINAKISGGKLSTSQETTLLTSYEAVIDCDEVRDIIYTDFRQLAIEISEKNPENELDKLCFVQPERCIESIFDKYLQQYVITLEDVCGNRISVRARYTAENKNFIELIESIGQKMLKNPRKNYVFLATAYIYDGELTLFPIEIYDFIKKKHNEPYELPEKYGNTDVTAGYAGKILDFFNDVNDKIAVIVRSGLQADIKNDHKLENLAFNYGLKGFSRIIGDFMECASSYRHRTNADCTEILLKINMIYQYMKQGRKSLEIITSLSNMKGIN